MFAVIFNLQDIWLLGPSNSIPSDGGAAVLTPDTDLTWAELEQGGKSPPVRSGM